jgi:hypothetical protein
VIEALAADGADDAFDERILPGGPWSNAHLFDAVVPTVKGSPYSMGIQQFLLDPEDPFQNGFRLG